VGDRFDTSASRRRRGGLWLVLTAVMLAFLAGALAMAWAARSGRLPSLVRPAQPPQPVVVKPVIQAPASAVAATVDPATLSVREGVLAGQLAALEARTAAVTADALAAGGEAGRAEGLLVAVAARRAIDRGLPLGYLEPQIHARFGVILPRAVDVVLEAGARPVTREDLRLGLDNLAPTLTSDVDAGWWASLRRELGSLVVLREAGTPSALPADRLERAQRLIDAGQVEAARAEVARMPGVDSAGNWLDAARRYVLARHALDAMEGAALTGRAAPAR
jgi:hypothetical protein